MVEQPGQKAAGRGPQTVRIGTSGRSRPMSADDIQKAKMRAQYMNSKNIKKDTLPSAIGDTRTVVPENPLAIQSVKDSPPSQKNEAKTEENTPEPSTVQFPPSQNNEAKTEDTPEPSAVQQPVTVNVPVQTVSSPAVNVPVQADEFRNRKLSTPPKSISSKVGVMLRMSPHTILKNCKRKQIEWHVPPGIPSH